MGGEPRSGEAVGDITGDTDGERGMGTECRECAPSSPILVQGLDRRRGGVRERERRHGSFHSIAAATPRARLRSLPPHFRFQSPRCSCPRRGGGEVLFRREGGGDRERLFDDDLRKDNKTTCLVKKNKKKNHHRRHKEENTTVVRKHQNMLSLTQTIGNVAFGTDFLQFHEPVRAKKQYAREDCENTHHSTENNIAFPYCSACPLRSGPFASTSATIPTAERRKIEDQYSEGERGGGGGRERERERERERPLSFKERRTGWEVLTLCDLPSPSAFWWGFQEENHFLCHHPSEQQAPDCVLAVAPAADADGFPPVVVASFGAPRQFRWHAPCVGSLAA